MPISKTFTTKSTKHGWSVETTVELPGNGSEADLVQAKYGSEERVYAEAASSYVIALQNNMRKRQTPEQAVAFAADWKDDGSKDTFKPTLSEQDKKEGKFTEAQLKILRAAGMKI